MFNAKSNDSGHFQILTPSQCLHRLLSLQKYLKRNSVIVGQPQKRIKLQRQRLSRHIQRVQNRNRQVTVRCQREPLPHKIMRGRVRRVQNDGAGRAQGRDNSQLPGGSEAGT